MRGRVPARARLPFTGIVDTVARVVDEHDTARTGTPSTVADVLEAEGWARARARELAADRRRTEAATHDRTLMVVLGVVVFVVGLLLSIACTSSATFSPPSSSG